MSKQNDLILNRIANPEFSISDFKEVGVIAENTSLEKEEAYAQHSMIKDNPNFQDAEGNFDKVKFHEFYTESQAMYNNMADDSYQEDLIKQTTFHRDNIFAPYDQRREGPDFEFVKTPNPFRQTTSMIRLGVTEDPTLSADEIAQTQRVLLNPKGVANGEDPKYGSSPNDSWFEDFWDTRVMAQYDEDGEHVDPITGQTVKHKKGDLKLNENGTFYYESLDGRDVYGRRVLNKMNTLTRDGSYLNQYDFFDSDDIEQKSVGGTIMKNLALVGSMFIPYVGPAIAGISMLSQAAGMFATFGKMLAGSDSPTLSAIEGWSKSVNRQTAKTEYAQNNMWCWENFIGLIGDVAGQLAEQRVLFKYGPALIEGKYGMSAEGKEAFIKKKLEEYNAITKAASQKVVDQGGNIFTRAKLAKEAQKVNTWKAMADWDSYIKGYNKLGSIMSKTYMTGITVADTYGEAKLNKASDTEAALLTMGYAAAEYALLSTGLGEWMFPELRQNKAHQQAVAKALTQLKKDGKVVEAKMSEAATKEAQQEIKKNWFKTIFNKGKQLANDLYTANKSVGGKALTTMAYNAMAEGLEETSEELLADFSKACFNIVGSLRGDETRMQTFDGGDISKLLSRYSMSLVGGAVGGGLAGMSLARNNQSFENMDYNQAFQHLIYMHRNGEIKDFYKTVDKMEGLGNKYLSTKMIKDKDGNFTGDFEQGTAEDNQDLAAKQMVKAQSELVGSILTSNGIKISDESYLQHHVDLLGDAKYSALMHSTVAGKMLQDFNSLSARIVTLQSQLIDDSKTDEQKRAENSEKTEGDKIVKETNKQVQEELNTLLAKRDALLKGEMTANYVEAALFELTDNISSVFTKPTFIRFAEYKAGVPLHQIGKDQLNELKKEYANWDKTEKAEQMYIMSQIFKTISQNSSNVITSQAQAYEMQAQNEDLNALMPLIKDSLDPQDIKMFLLGQRQDPDDNDAWQEEAQERVENRNTDFIRIVLENSGTEADKVKLEQLKQRYLALESDTTLEESTKQVRMEEIQDEFNDLYSNVLYNQLDSLVNPFINQGFINSEVRLQFQNALNQIKEVFTHKSSNQSRLINLTKDSISSIRVLSPEQKQTKLNSLETEEQKQEQIQKWEAAEAQRTLLQEKLNQQIENKALNDAKIKYINEQQEALNKLNHSGIEENLNQFSLSAIGRPTSITEILEKLNQTLLNRQEAISEFTFDSNLKVELDEALQVIELYRAAIDAAKVDNGNVDNLFGYNATVNEVNKKLGTEGFIPLAEINSDTGNILIQDLSIIRNKLLFYKNLYEINNGQKINKQKRVGLNKDYIFYGKMQKLITQVPDNWKDKDKLKSTLESLENLKKNYQQKRLDVSKDVRDAITQEMVKLEDAIYDFFEANSDKLSDSNLLSELINPSKLSLYTVPNELINEGTEDLDDNSFVWWLATRAAVKSSIFHKRFASVINNKIAPIPTQMLAIYTNYASIVNGGVFDVFYDAFRKAVVSDWKTKTTNDRIAILKDLYYDEDSAALIADKKYDDTILTVLPTLRYKNIVFTEGTPGSGKTTGVYMGTIEILKKYHNDDKILDNVWVIHGGSKDSAENIIKQLGLKNATAFTVDEYLDAITQDRKKFVEVAPGVFEIDSDAVKITEEGELKSATKTRALSTPPSLVIIDEITKINTLDLDAIDESASKHGYSILGAGDLDQSKFKGRVSLSQSDFKTMDLTISRNYFARTPKLGVTMRTAYSQKTVNNVALQAFIQNPTDDAIIPLHYYMDENGIYGDIVYSVDEDADVMDQDDFKQMLELIIKTAKPTSNGQPPIGYVYYDQNSSLYQELSQEKYKGIVELLPGTSAQGKEGQYYIIETKPYNEDDPTDFDDVYTALTRAQQGSLMIQNINIGGVSNIKHKDKVVSFEEHQDDYTIEDGLQPEVIAQYSAETKELYESFLNNDQGLEYKKRKGTVVVSESTTEKTPEVATPASGSIDDTVVPPPNVEEPPVIPENTSVPPPPEIPEGAIPPPSLDSESAGPMLNVPPPPESFAPKETGRNRQYTPQRPVIPPPPEDMAPRETGRNKQYNRRPTIPPPPPEMAPPEKGVISSGKKVINTPQAKTPEPITPKTDIIPEQEYKNSLIQMSVPKKPVKSIIKTRRDGTKKLILNAYTFNTFETGVVKGSDGMPVQTGSDQARHARRIDSINGLINLDKKLGLPVRTYDEYVQMIATLRDIMLNVEEENLQDTLQLFLTDNFGTNLENRGISHTFVWKSVANPPTGSKQEFGTKDDSRYDQYKIFDKSNNEKVLFTNNRNVRGDERLRKTIGVILGIDELGDVLELPLFKLPNPITLLYQEGFEEPLAIWNNILTSSDDLNIKQQIDMLISELNKIKTQDGKVIWKELTEMFSNYLLTENLIVQLPKAFKISKLKRVGPVMVSNDRNQNYEVEGFEYDQGYVDIEQMAENPGIHISSILVSKEKHLDDGQGNVVSKDLLNPGHPMVLYSYDETLSSDEDLVRYFVQQEADPKLPKKVGLAYVLPPKVDIDEYLTMLHNLFNGEFSKSNLDDIGNLFSSYKLTKALLENNEFVEYLNNIKLENAKVILDELKTLINEVDAVTGTDELSIWKAQKLVLTQVRKSKLAKGEFQIHAIFKNFLHGLRYPSGQAITNYKTIDTTPVLDIMRKALTNAGIDGIYYHTSLDVESTSIGTFLRAKQQPNWKIRDSKGNLLSYQIHGNLNQDVFQIDDSVFGYKNNIFRIVNSSVELHQDGNRYHSGITGIKYMNGNLTGTKKDIENDPQKVAREKELEKRSNFVINFNKKYNTNWNPSSLETVYLEAAQLLNSGDFGVYAEVFGNDLLIARNYDTFKSKSGLTIETTSEGTTITNNETGVVYDVIEKDLSKGIMKLVPRENNNVTQTILNITPNEITVNGISITESEYPIISDYLEKIPKKGLMDEFIATFNKYKIAGTKSNDQITEATVLLESINKIKGSTDTIIKLIRKFNDKADDTVVNKIQELVKLKDNNLKPEDLCSLGTSPKQINIVFDL